MTKSGADLQSKVATFGTVRLIVDHAEEHYEIQADRNYELPDQLEIVNYLADHGFEVMGPDECPVEATVYGWRMWACHVDGAQFGFITPALAFSVVAASIVFPAIPVIEHCMRFFGELAA
jgi:hypothetical protein